MEQRKDSLVSKGKQQQHVGSDSDEDSDVEKNYALLVKRGGPSGGMEEYNNSDEEEFEGSEEGEEVEDQSEGTDEEESKAGEEEEGSHVGEQGDSDDGEKEGDEGEKEVDEDGESSEASEEDTEDDEDPEGGGGSEIHTKEDIRNELSTMSFEDIMKLQNKVGTKVYNEVAYGSSKSQKPSKKKRLNKNRPVEISAKKRTPFLRQVVPVKKQTLRDPRFDDLSGEYKPEIFEKTYKFINDIKQREKEVVKKQLKKTKKSNQKKEELQFLLKRLENQERARQSREQKRERELEFKRQQRERANQGTQPFFLKKSEKKKLQLAEKYQELKKSGKLENFLSKKRKRNATKDRRKLPRQPQN
ncbi:ribosomal RNA processing protein 36 homolog [Cololabis saira]|uniref:ribosomal RNA processing protein 36 homolog n=1 Tax=Cololabis saira TaxID=129043 RepID=UPI002AD2C99E|nr:ribosomal RNA processing protein 36 homolog [Cololabis saira]